MNDTVSSATSPHPVSITEWTATEPCPTGAYEHDTSGYASFWRSAEALMRQLPSKPERVMT